MSCNLSKTATYNVGRVIHDNSNDQYTVQLVNPPSTCPDKTFVSKKAGLKVVDGINPELIFNFAENRPVIVVPHKSYVEQVGSSGFGLGTLVLVSLLCAVVIAFFAVVLQSRKDEENNEDTSVKPNPSNPQSPSSGTTVQSGTFYHRYGSTSAPRQVHVVQPQPVVQAAPATTTIINNGNNSGNNGFVEGMLIGEALSNRGHDRVIERETVIERQVPSSSSGSYSSDSNSDDSDSYSSDSSSDDNSSYSSDGDDSSYSSDSGSDYSSDSGGSDFSSDS